MDLLDYAGAQPIVVFRHALKWIDIEPLKVPLKVGELIYSEDEREIRLLYQAKFVIGGWLEEHPDFGELRVHVSDIRITPLMILEFSDDEERRDARDQDAIWKVEKALLPW